MGKNSPVIVDGFWLLQIEKSSIFAKVMKVQILGQGGAVKRPPMDEMT